MKKTKERLENRARILKEHIKLDNEWINDNFIGQFMVGRIYMEEKWLEETENLLDLEDGKFTVDELIPVLEERRAILKTYITEEKSRFNSTQGQEMRGRCVICQRWLEDTEKMLNVFHGTRG